MTVRGLENTSVDKQRRKHFFWKLILVHVSCSNSRLVDLAMKDVDWSTYRFLVLSLINSMLLESLLQVIEILLI